MAKALSRVKPMQRMENAPAGMVGWMDEMEHAEEMVLSGPGELQVKLVVTPRGILAFALAERADEARRLLVDLGFHPGHIRRLLCG